MQDLNSGVLSNKYRVFLSHGSGDNFIVSRFLKPQVEASGALVFVDQIAIEYGDDFKVKILSQITLVHELLVFFTPSSLSRPWVYAEIGAALALGKRIVGVLYGPSEGELQKIGALSLLGESNLLHIDHFDAYVEQLRVRVTGYQNG